MFYVEGIVRITQVRLFNRLTADDAIWHPGGITHLDIRISIDAQQLILGISAASMLIPQKITPPCGSFLGYSVLRGSLHESGRKKTC